MKPIQTAKGQIKQREDYPDLYTAIHTRSGSIKSFHTVKEAKQWLKTGPFTLFEEWAIQKGYVSGS